MVIAPRFTSAATSDLCDRMRESDGMIVHHRRANPCTCAHIESKSVVGTCQWLEHHHPTM